MGNIMDYLDWRGDITFEQSPFNEVDNVILAQLAYVNFRDIIPSPEEKRSVTLKEASQMFFDMYTEKELKQDKSFIREALSIIQSKLDCNNYYLYNPEFDKNCNCIKK